MLSATLVAECQGDPWLIEADEEGTAAHVSDRELPQNPHSQPSLPQQ
jgi:hypothetical protein